MPELIPAHTRLVVGQPLRLDLSVTRASITASSVAVRAVCGRKTFLSGNARVVCAAPKTTTKRSFTVRAADEVRSFLQSDWTAATRAARGFAFFGRSTEGLHRRVWVLNTARARPPRAVSTRRTRRACLGANDNARFFSPMRGCGMGPSVPIVLSRDTCSIV